MLDFLKRVWRDPVWSKVISVGILAAIAWLMAWPMHMLNYRIPSWPLVVPLAIIVLLVPYWWRAIRKRKPELHMAWHGSAGWGIGGLLTMQGIEQILRIQGPVLISSSYFEEPVMITEIELRDAEYAGPNFQAFQVKPGETIPHTLMLNFRGEMPVPGKAFNAYLTFVDIKGNKYPLTPATLRAFPGLDVPPIEPKKPKPVLNTAWRIKSWCWAQVGSEKLVRIVLEGMMQFNGISGRIIITSARVNSIEAVGAFDNFPVEPDQEFYHSISLNVRGITPAGKAPIKAAVTLADLQGNEYPLREETFTPYDEPTRWVGGLAWPKD